MGASYEQYQDDGRGDGASGSDLQLTFNLFPSEAEQKQIIIDTGKVLEKSSLPFLSQETIDTVLCSVEAVSKLRICAEYKKAKNVAEIMIRLKKEYTGGRGLVINGDRTAIWCSKEGIRVARGNAAQFKETAQVLSWEDAVVRIGELLDAGKFMDAELLERVNDFERQEVAQSIWYLRQSLSEHKEGELYLPLISEHYNSFPDSVAEIKELLEDPHYRSRIETELESFAVVYMQDRSFLQYHNYKPEDILIRVRELGWQRKKYDYTGAQIPLADKGFISQDEIDQNLLSGSNFQDSRMRIYNFLSVPHTLEEKVTFLKEEYGIGGSSAVNQMSQWHDAKGIKYSRKGCDDILLKWSKVAQRIDWQITQGLYEKFGDISKSEPVSETENVKTSPLEPAKIRLYKAFAKIAPQVLSGEKTYLELQANAHDMDLDIEMISSDHVIVAHRYDLNGDRLADPEMEFVLDKARKTLSVRAYTNDTLGRFDEVSDEPGEENVELLEELEDYALSWFENIVRKSYVLVPEMRTEDLTEPNTERALKEYHSTAALPALIDEGLEGALVKDFLKDASVDAQQVEKWFMDGDDMYLPSKYIRDSASQAYTEILVEDQRCGFKAFDNGCLLWKGSFLNRSAETLYSWDDFAEKVRTLLFARADIDLENNPYADKTLGGALDLFGGDNEPQNRGIRKLNENSHDNDRLENKARETQKYSISDYGLGKGNKTEKFNANIRAIRTLKQIESENRLATPEEQEQLSRYVGWGGLQEAFIAGGTQNEELISLLTKEEYKAAMGSVLNAYYTQPLIVEKMYDVIENLGFRGGTVLEPAVGVGNFFGKMPDSIRSNSKLYGVELDSISGRIARQIYPDAEIQIKGFEETKYIDNSFDLAIGNVPFGDYGVNDSKYSHGFMIHDYFFAKSLDKVRSGGVIAFITSSGTMDKKNSRVRQHLAQQADLLGAIRLPDMAFKANAGTEAATDILFLQKKLQPGLENDLDWVRVSEGAEGLAYNEYFLNHPELIVGQMKEVPGPFGMRVVCQLDDESRFSEKLADAAARIKGTIAPAPELIVLPQVQQENNDMVSEEIPDYSYGVNVHGRIIFNENGKLKEIDHKGVEAKRITGMIAIRDDARRLIDAQVNNLPEERIQSLMKALNRNYDAYTAKYGLLTSRDNRRAFGNDASYPLLCSLEVLNEDGELVRKADMFTKRTIRKAVTAASVDTPEEALAVSLAEKGHVDINYMATLCNMEKPAVVFGLRGQIYQLPGENEYVTADEYLSGNIKEKIQVAQAYPDFSANVKALEEVMPKPLNSQEIDVRLGSNWVPVEIYKHFIYYLLKTPFYLQGGSIDLDYSERLDVWNIKGKSLAGNVMVNTTYGTSRANAYRIIENTLNLRTMRITDEIEDGNGKVKRVINPKETALACQKQDLIKEKFQEWIWENPDRREQLCKIYNERFNVTVPREYSGDHLQFPGMNPEYELSPHQKRAVARQLYGGNTLLAHCVGAGKTFEIAAAIMEKKRLGICNKAMIVVPNHLIGQWASEFVTLYPGSKLLAVTENDFTKDKRKEFCSRIATSDVDAVIIAHSQFGMIPLSKERQERFLRQQLDEIQSEIIMAKEENEQNFTVKQLIGMEKKLSKKLTDLIQAGRKDDVIDFEALGIDFLCIDEAHEFKNLALQTKMRNVAGVSTGGANKSYDLFAKCGYIDEVTGGKGITFATGTPVSNSIAELYTMQRYLQYKELQKLGMVTFDRWASTFAESTTAYELSPEGTGYRQKTRFARFFNLPELMNIFKGCADIQTADMLKLDVPEVVYTNIVLPPSEYQKVMLKEIGDRADRIRNGSVDPWEDNMLKITTDGRRLALDERLLHSDSNAEIQEAMPAVHESKIDACVKKSVEIYMETIEDKSTQLIFCDMSTPKSDGSFSVYADIRDKLIHEGIPNDEIAFIHDANTNARKQELFAKVRKGSIRILLGSTSKMGAGMNVQSRLIALHHLDVPWKPSDIEQREGRIIRQGNMNIRVQVYRYITENTFDAYSWQIIENKQKFIGQIMTSKSPVRSCEDIDENVFSAAEAKALAVGNPLIKEKIELDNEVSRLHLLKGNFENERHRMQDDLVKNLPLELSQILEKIQQTQVDLTYLSGIKLPDTEDFVIRVDDRAYRDKKEGGNELLKAVIRNRKEEKFIEVGEYLGFRILGKYDGLRKEVYLRIQRESSTVIQIGSDPVGAITRINNVLQKMPDKLTEKTLQKEQIESEMKNIECELSKPFEKQKELEEKTKRLSELTGILEMKSPDEEKSITASKENILKKL